MQTIILLLLAIQVDLFQLVLYYAGQYRRRENQSHRLQLGRSRLAPFGQSMIVLAMDRVLHLRYGEQSRPAWTAVTECLAVHHPIGEPDVSIVVVNTTTVGRLEGTVVVHGQENPYRQACLRVAVHLDIGGIRTEGVLFHIPTALVRVKKYVPLVSMMTYAEGVFPTNTDIYLPRLRNDRARYRGRLARSFEKRRRRWHRRRPVRPAGSREHRQPLRAFHSGH